MSLPSVLASASCYSPGGKLAFLDQPCDPAAPVSFCCPPSAICSANKLCVLPGGQPLRATCTDSTWQNGECPDFCLAEPNSLDPDSGRKMTLCQTDLDSTSYCCNGQGESKCDCSSESGYLVKLQTYKAMTTIPAVTPTFHRMLTSSAASLPTDNYTRPPMYPVNANPRLTPWHVAGITSLAVVASLATATLLWFIRKCLKARNNHENGDAIDPVAAQKSGVFWQRKNSDALWSVYLDKDMLKARFSIGSTGSHVGGPFGEKNFASRTGSKVVSRRRGSRDEQEEPLSPKTATKRADQILSFPRPPTANVATANQKDSAQPGSRLGRLTLEEVLLKPFPGRRSTVY